MQVRLGVTRKVEVDDHVDGLDVDAAREQIRAHQVAAMALAKFVEHPVPMVLGHLGVDVVARVAEFGDFLRKQLNTLGGIAEDDGLVDLQLNTCILLVFLIKANKTLRKSVFKQCTFCFSCTYA